MAKSPKRPGDEDPEQSKRFLDLAHELEAAGELNPTEDGGAFEKLARKVMPPVRPKPSQ